MEKINYSPYATDHYYQTPQEDGQHASQPEAGQASAGVSASGALGQPYLDLNLPAQTDWEYLQPPQSIAAHQEDGQHASQPEAGQTSAGAPASGASWSHPAPRQPYLDLNLSAQMLSSSRPDWEYLQCSPQPISAEGVCQSEESFAPANHRLAVGARHSRLPPVKGRFLAGLEAYARGVPLKDCSSSLRFSDYINSDGSLVRKGISLYRQFTPAEKTRLDQAIIARLGASPEQEGNGGTVTERFLAGLDQYAQGVKLVNCSATLRYRSYVSDEGSLHEKGKSLRESLSPEDQERVDRALLSRNEFYRERSVGKGTVEERFLASLDNYARGVQLTRCAEDIRLSRYVNDDGYLQPQGLALYNRLGPDNKLRVEQALTARGEVVTQLTSKDVAKFMATLEPYADGQPLEECGDQSGLKRKAITYLTPEGGLTSKGKRLIENLQPSQRNEVSDAITKRQRHTELNPQEPGPSWQWPVMLSPMPQTGGMNPTAIADPRQTEAMQATVWQFTGQAVAGPLASAEPPIPYLNREAVGSDFQHQYGPNGLIPQRAPDRLIGRGIVHDTLINILDEVYRVHDTRNPVQPTNENPQGKNFMLIPCMRGG
jgi:hypothetical protein